MTFFDFIDKHMGVIGISGIVVISVLCAIAIYQYVIKDVIGAYLTYRLDIKKSKADMESTIQIDKEKNTFESHKIKMEKVMPLHTEFSTHLQEFSVLFMGYLETIRSSGRNTDNRSRGDIAKKLELVGSKISVYVTNSTRMINAQICAIARNDFSDPHTVRAAANEKGYDINSIIEICMKVFSDFTACYYNMVSLEGNLTMDNQDLLDIMSENNILPNQGSYDISIYPNKAEAEFCLNEVIYRRK